MTSSEGHLGIMRASSGTHSRVIWGSSGGYPAAIGVSWAVIRGSSHDDQDSDDDNDDDDDDDDYDD
eukprot:11436662-Karenia_brevis.AAC.1